MDAFEEFLSERLACRTENEEKLRAIKSQYFEAKSRRIIEDLSNRRGKELPFDEFLVDRHIGIVTIRKAFNADSTLLKPAGTFPDEMLEVAHRFAKQIVPQTFVDVEQSLEGISESEVPEVDGDDCIYFSAVYETSGDSSSEKAESPRFSDRIDIAFDQLKDHDSDKFKDGATCFFSVKARPYEPNGEKIGYRIAQIIAIYFSEGTKITADQRNRAHKNCRELFDESDRIRELEENLFVLEGHELTASLQPLFLNENVAPADKIAFAVEKLKLLLRRHLHSHYPDPHPDLHDTSVYFVSLAYEVPDRDKKDEVVPTFQVYPHVYRRELAYGAFLIGHPMRPAVSKYLLRKYLRAKRTSDGESLDFLIGSHNFDKTKPNPATIRNDFMIDLFAEVDKEISRARENGREGINYLDEKEPDQVYLSKLNRGSDDSLWSALNVDVGPLNAVAEAIEAAGTSVRPNNSILAYVIEGREVGKGDDGVIYRQLPRAILAIESTHHEMLSLREREAMRTVAHSLSHLVRHVFHDNTLLDYRRQLSLAYESFVQHEDAEDKSSLGERLILAAMSIDVLLLKDIKKQAKKDALHDRVISEVEKIYKKVLKGTGYADEGMSRDELVKEQIGLRFENAVAYLSTESIPSQEAIDFLEACPRNFAWAGYAPSLAQALGDRADHKPPRFTLMTPGFSASGLYMAVVKGEIRQVAKLSPVNKLIKERENYRKHVRYKVLVASRSPANAFAFDSGGLAGKESGKTGDKTFEPGENYTKTCYGVLVADLASSKKLDPEKTDMGHGVGDESVPEVATFLDRVIDVVDENRLTLLGDETKGQVAFKEVAQSIRSLFENNFGHWFSIEKYPAEFKFRAQLREMFRLDYETKLKARLEEEYRIALAAWERNQSTGKLDQPRPEMALPTSDGRKNLVWTEFAFERLGNGVADSPVQYEQNRFPLEYSEDERLEAGGECACIPPRTIAEFCCIRRTQNRSVDQGRKNELASIAHRDLNAQNLVWAGPIQSFMMIDFEHTGQGYWGMDQARLAVNTVVDFLSKITEPDDSYTQFTEVANAAEFLVDVWKSLSGYQSWRMYWKEYLEGEPPCANLPSPGDRLTCIVRLIVWLIWQNTPKFQRNEVLELYEVELGFAVVKEYEYGMVNVRRARLNRSQRIAVRQAMRDSEGDLKHLLVGVYEALKDKSSEDFDEDSANPRLAFQFAAVSRFLVSRWILQSLIYRENGQERR